MLAAANRSPSNEGREAPGSLKLHRQESQHPKGRTMKPSFIRLIASASALTLTGMFGPVAIAAGTTASYSWTEILIPRIGPLSSAFGINDYDQVTVTNADGSKTGIYRNGIFTPLPAPPAGYKVSALGINNAAAIVGRDYCALLLYAPWFHWPALHSLRMVF